MSQKPIKIKIVVTAVVEYEADPENYPENKRTTEKMLKVDLASADDDTFGFISGDNVTWKIEGSVVS